MGKRGFAKQPQAIAKMKGTYRKDRYKNIMPITELTYLESVPDPPGILNSDGIKFWNTNLNKLILIEGLMTKMDLPLFGELCYNYQLMVQCNRAINETGPTCTDSKGKKGISPYWKKYKEVQKNFVNLSREYGLSPSSRSNGKIESKSDSDLLKEFQL